MLVHLHEVVGNNWGLGKDTGGSLGGGDVGTISEGEDVGIFVVLEGGCIDVYHA